MNQLKLQICFMIYLILISTILYIRPSFLYNSDNTLKQFGTGSDSTIAPLWLLIILSAIVSYFITSIIVILF
jgi:hypothetical protein